MLKKKTNTGVAQPTESRVKELIDEALRDAFREHSRDLEKHLVDIHKRVSALETKRG